VGSFLSVGKVKAASTSYREECRLKWIVRHSIRNTEVVAGLATSSGSKSTPGI
jgi:hypothetical protein